VSRGAHSRIAAEPQSNGRLPRAKADAAPTRKTADAARCFSSSYQGTLNALARKLEASSPRGY